MSGNHPILEKAVMRALSGEGAHVNAKKVFAGLNWKLAGVRPAGVSHSIFELLNHLTFWQDWVVKWLDGASPTVPKHAPGGWPGGSAPASANEWQQAVRRFNKALGDMARQSREADLLAKRGKTNRLEMLRAITQHNSYHLGQAVQLRQMLGAWPPPGGGLTW